MNLSNNREIHQTRVFSKDLKKLPDGTKQNCWETVLLLADNISRPSIEVKKLHGYKNVWRAKVQHVYRLIFTFDENSLYLLRIVHRKDVYRKPFQDLD